MRRLSQHAVQLIEPTPSQIHHGACCYPTQPTRRAKGALQSRRDLHMSHAGGCNFCNPATQAAGQVSTAVDDLNQISSQPDGQASLPKDDMTWTQALRAGAQGLMAIPIRPDHYDITLCPAWFGKKTNKSNPDHAAWRQTPMVLLVHPRHCKKGQVG